MLIFKDAALEALSHRANVAQFVGFAPDLAQTYARVRGCEPNHAFASPEEAVAALLAASGERSVNVRSFDPEDPKSREFVYGVKDAGEVLAHLRRLAARGLHTIVNETVDVCDGGVSGVMVGGVMEFAPCDTPRCVEKPGAAALPREMGLRLLERVYGFRPALDYAPEQRVEFSVHPLRRGFRHEHTIAWELEEVGPAGLAAAVRWPNRFSRFVGDKAFGLLVADAVGLPVPRTTVIPRALPPFTFGRPTGTAETWIRTCPVEQEPGRFTTERGWLDPFKLMGREDPAGEAIASVLAQEGVEAAYSGSLVSTPQEGEIILEGVRGFGDRFMLGRAGREELPEEVSRAVRGLYEEARAHLGSPRLEWVYDGRRAWCVQLHAGATLSTGDTIYPGEADSYRRFDVALGLDALRELIASLKGTGEGVILVGNVGVTSHFGDVLRRARVPSKVERP